MRRYDSIGRGYWRTRREDSRIAAYVHRALGDARAVVNVGAGTGSYEPRDRHVVAIEPSDGMASQRPRDVPPAIRASAGELPLRNASVDARAHHGAPGPVDGRENSSPKPPWRPGWSLITDQGWAAMADHLPATPRRARLRGGTVGATAPARAGCSPAPRSVVSSRVAIARRKRPGGVGCVESKWARGGGRSQRRRVGARRGPRAGIGSWHAQDVGAKALFEPVRVLRLGIGPGLARASTGSRCGVRACAAPLFIGDERRTDGPEEHIHGRDGLATAAIAE